MRILPPALCAAICKQLGAPPRNATALTGGMINRAIRAEVNEQPVFIKWSDRAEAGHFTAEADGLRRLGDTGTLRVPQVLAVGEGEAFRYLALEYIEPSPCIHPAKMAVRFGEQLACLHKTTQCNYGLDTDNWIGALHQPNTPSPSWPEFYRDQRLLPMIAIAREKELLPPEREALLMKVIDLLDELLSDLPVCPALIHGDMWAGNLLEAGDTPVVIDPAVYFAEREMEIAYMQLFGGFARETFDAYNAVYPLHPGYLHRRPLHQLYPLLSHLNHFGEQYGPDIEEACRVYV